MDRQEILKNWKLFFKIESFLPVLRHNANNGEQKYVYCDSLFAKFVSLNDFVEK